MSEISFEKFVTEFAYDLGIGDTQDIKLPLRDVPQYDSMGKITASLTVERLFGFQISYEILDDAETLRALYDYCIKQEPTR